MTEWERTGDTKWRDKIVAGMDSIAAMPYGFLTGPNQLYGYDPKTGKLYALENEVGTYNLATIMGGGEVVFELNTLIDHAGWKKAWEQYCRLHTARKDVIERDKSTARKARARSSHGRAAYRATCTRSIRTRPTQRRHGPGCASHNSARAKWRAPTSCCQSTRSLGYPRILSRRAAWKPSRCCR
jgi:hypothetical protein